MTKKSDLIIPTFLMGMYTLLIVLPVKLGIYYAVASSLENFPTWGWHLLYAYAPIQVLGAILYQMLQAAERKAE